MSPIDQSKEVSSLLHSYLTLLADHPGSGLDRWSQSLHPPNPRCRLRHVWCRGSYGRPRRSDQVQGQHEQVAASTHLCSLRCGELGWTWLQVLCSPHQGRCRLGQGQSFLSMPSLFLSFSCFSTDSRHCHSKRSSPFSRQSRSEPKVLPFPLPHLPLAYPLPGGVLYVHSSKQNGNTPVPKAMLEVGAFFGVQPADATVRLILIYRNFLSISHFEPEPIASPLFCANLCGCLTWAREQDRGPDRPCCCL